MNRNIAVSKDILAEFELQIGDIGHIRIKQDRLDRQAVRGSTYTVL